MESSRIAVRSNGLVRPRGHPTRINALAAVSYRLTRVVYKLRKEARPKLSHHRSQVVNNSAPMQAWSVDKCASFIFLRPANTHRPATNMQRKRSFDHCNQSFGRARCAPVRQTNSHLPTRFQRLDYKAFAEREQCVFTPKTQINTRAKKGELP